jgi:hypothetical protein
MANMTPNDREQDRLWEHRQSLNEDFNSLSNYFMLAQSFLLVVALSNSGGASAQRLAVIILGFALTLIWLYVQSKQRYLLTHLKKRCAMEFPEYAKTRLQRQHPIWRLSNTWIMAVLVPVLFAAAWVVIFLGVLIVK